LDEKKTKDEEKIEDEGADIDLGIGKLSLGGLFGGIEKLIDLAAQVKKAGGEIKEEGEIDLSHLKKGMKGVFGFSVKTATGGNPVVEPFGNIKKTPKGPVVKEEREPIVDVFDENDHILVVIELPGVKQGDMDIDVQGDILNISTPGSEKKYRKEILLPSKVEEVPISSAYKNGIVEIKLKKSE